MSLVKRLKGFFEPCRDIPWAESRPPKYNEGGVMMAKLGGEPGDRKMRCPDCEHWWGLQDQRRPVKYRCSCGTLLIVRGEEG